MMESSGKKFRNLVNETKPLQIVGTVNAYSAIMAEKVGHQSIYLSGGGVAASSLGVPDLGITSLADVLEDAKRITQVTSLPLLVDADTGWGGAFNIARCVQEMIKSNVAAIHIEDQVSQKRCGPLISEEVFAIIMENAEILNNHIDYKRDHNYDYFGFKTLERSYLLRLNGEIAERPQHMLLRVAVGIHHHNISKALETYDLMSQGYFTHATPKYCLQDYY